MIVVLASLLMAGVQTLPPATVRAEAPAATRLRPHPPVTRREIMVEVPANLREPAICFSHMELLIEKLSAVGEQSDTRVLMVQEYWESRMPDPDSEGGLDGEIITRIKNSLDHASRADPNEYIRQLQGCVTEAAAAGALD